MKNLRKLSNLIVVNTHHQSAPILLAKPLAKYFFKERKGASIRYQLNIHKDKSEALYRRVEISINGVLGIFMK